MLSKSVSPRAVFLVNNLWRHYKRDTLANSVKSRGPMSVLSRMLLFCICTAGVANHVYGQTPPAPKDAILILDASGSMWGQIDGVNKIVIAKDVVEELVRGLPEEQRLGMVAYGHRKKGDCEDIETLADVGENRDKVISKIRGLSPKGKTPLTKSVEHSALALDYTKNAASIILVSDGLETCEADPCALAKTLEENGLDFTVHVIGFDVTEEERKGLACIADETGGKFLSADNAEELGEALAQVAMADVEVEIGEPEAKPQTVALKATVMLNGPDIQSKLNWKVTRVESDEVVFEKENVGYVDFEIVPGEYIAEAVWTGWPHQTERYKGDKSGSKSFTVIASRPSVVSVPVDIDIPVTLTADGEIVEGGEVNVTWSGPDELGAIVVINRLDDGPRERIYFTPAQKGRDSYQKENEKAGKQTSELDTDGDGDFDQDDLARAKVGGPSIEGDYEIRYVLNSPRLILKRVPLTVTDGAYTVSAPEKVPAASEFSVTWAGTMTPNDFITIEKAGTKSAFTPFGGRPRLQQGVPMKLVAPAEPGDYEIRYVLANGYTTYPGMQHAVQAMQSVIVTPVEADVTGPVTVVGGSTVTYEVSPPDASFSDDYISFIAPGASKYSRDSYGNLAKGEVPGKTVQIRAPAVAGEYEIAYFLRPGDKILSRKAVTVTQAIAAVDAPDNVKAGTDFKVTYSGDAFKGDRVIICPEDTPDNKMWQWGVNYGCAAKQGETEGLVRGGYKAAQKPGRYEARYVTGLQNVVIARDKFVVVE